MLKNNTFLASIFEGFGRRFGMVFGRFFEAKTHLIQKMQNFENPYETLAMRTKIKDRNLKNQRILSNMYRKIACFFGHRF